jgi:hypothetical protein
MKRVKQYRIRLTEEEDALLKQKARDLSLSAADVIRLGIRYFVGEKEFAMLTERRFTELRENSELIRNWEQSFEQSIFHEVGKKWQEKLQLAYLQTLEAYKDFIHYTDGKFVSNSFEAEESRDTTPVVEETQSETISEQKVKADICHSLTRFLGGEWQGDEWIVNTFLAGLKVDLARSV